MVRAGRGVGGSQEPLQGLERRWVGNATHIRGHMSGRLTAFKPGEPRGCNLWGATK